jgi:hypothetical protein
VCQHQVSETDGFSNYGGKMRKIILLACLLTCLFWANNCFADGVYVTNFPEKQITQDVNSIPSTVLNKIENIDIGTFTYLEVMDLSKKYLLDTGGYTKATVSMFGFPKAFDFKDCRVGVVLLPNEDAIWKAWQEDRVMILSSEVSTKVTAKDKYFQGQIEIDLHFPSYMIGFYNTCSTNVEISIYSYLK